MWFLRWPVSDYPQPFHCLDCETGWTTIPRCPDCGKRGESGPLPIAKLLRDDITHKSPKPQTHFSTTLKQT